MPAEAALRGLVFVKPMPELCPPEWGVDGMKRRRCQESSSLRKGNVRDRVVDADCRRNGIAGAGCTGRLWAVSGNVPDVSAPRNLGFRRNPCGRCSASRGQGLVKARAGVLLKATHICLGAGRSALLPDSNGSPDISAANLVRGSCIVSATRTAAPGQGCWASALRKGLCGGLLRWVVA